MIRDKSIKYLLAATLPITAGIIGAAPAIVRILYGPGFEPAVPVLRLLAWTIPLSALFSVTWRVLAARGEQGRVMKIQAVTSALRLLAGYPLITSMAAIGGAINFCASMVFQDLILLRYVERDGRRVPLLRMTWRFGAAAITVALVAMLALHWMNLWQVVVLGAAAYVIAVAALRAFSAEDLALFRKALQANRSAGS
jgi:PST family polysaccharide transporter/lipopolysaccharide exporter